jgi:hypothetical protein
VLFPSAYAFPVPFVRGIRDFEVDREDTSLHPKIIVSAYGDLLAQINEHERPESLKLLPGALPESLLPFPEETIRHALAIYLLHQDYIEERDIIEDAYSFLDNFIPDEEYELFLSLQRSMEEKDRTGPGPERWNRDLSYTMSLLRIRTRKMKKRRKHASQELKALRRIIGLPDKVFLHGDDDAEEALELELNL